MEVDPDNVPPESPPEPPADPPASPPPTARIEPPPPPSISRPRPNRPVKVERVQIVDDVPLDGGEPAPAAPRKKGGAREIPTDPTALAACRAEVAAETQIALFALDLIAKSLPPRTALTTDEKSMIEGPLADVLYKYDLVGSPEWRLVGALGAVFGIRYMNAKAKEAGIDA